MVIDSLPAESIATLDSFLKGIDTTNSARAAYQISQKMRRFDYGCDENVAKGIYRRFPHEMDRFTTCEDAGMFAYLAALRAGLDVGLYSFHNSRGMNQEHLEPVLRTSQRDYSFTVHHFDLFEKTAGAAEMVEYIPPHEAMQRLSAGRDDIKTFFKTGQLFQTQHFLGKGIVSQAPIPVSVTRSFIPKEGEFVFRKVYNIPGFYIIIERLKNHIKMYTATGVDNTVITQPILLEQYDMNGEELDINLASGVIPKEYRRKIMTRMYASDFVMSKVSAQGLTQYNAIQDLQPFLQTQKDMVHIAQLDAAIENRIKKLPKTVKEEFLADVHVDKCVDAARHYLVRQIQMFEQEFVHTKRQSDLIRKTEELLWGPQAEW